NQIGVVNETVRSASTGAPLSSFLNVAVSADINAHVPAALRPGPAGTNVLNNIGVTARLQPVGSPNSGHFYALLMENGVNILTDFTVVSIIRYSFLGSFAGAGGWQQSNNFGWTQITQSTVTVPFQGHVEFDVVNIDSTHVDLTALFNGVVV